MKMRVSIARAMVTRPKLLLMDEPFAALDEMTRFKLNNDTLATVAGANRFTTLFVTHSVYEAVYLSTRIVVMAARPRPRGGRDRGRRRRIRAPRPSAPRPATTSCACDFRFGRLQEREPRMLTRPIEPRTMRPPRPGLPACTAAVGASPCAGAAVCCWRWAAGRRSCAGTRSRTTSCLAPRSSLQTLWDNLGLAADAAGCSP
jgi:hypothetical protein